MNAYERIRYLRKDVLHLTQQKFSESLNMSRANTGNIEIGRIALTDRVISDICAKYHVNEEWIRSGTGPIFEEKLPIDEVSSYVEDLLEPDDDPFKDFIIEMMRTYHELDDTSKSAARLYFSKLRENLQKRRGTNVSPSFPNKFSKFHKSLRRFVCPFPTYMITSVLFQQDIFRTYVLPSDL